MSNLLNFSNKNENNIIAKYKFDNCKFGAEKTSSCRCSSRNTKYNYCNKKNIKILNLLECFQCGLFQKK